MVAPGWHALLIARGLDANVEPEMHPHGSTWLTYALFARVWEADYSQCCTETVAPGEAPKWERYREAIKEFARDAPEW